MSSAVTEVEASDATESKPEPEQEPELDEYAFVAKGRLSLKADSKKKKKQRPNPIEVPPSRPPEMRRTKAEMAFQKMQEKMQKERIAQKASMTHKQRVEKFNQHLDSLTEHFDIPKVSWTK